MFKNFKVYVLDAFTRDGAGGNKAGVVLEEGFALPDRARQEIARRAGFSETAFITVTSKELGTMTSTKPGGMTGTMPDLPNVYAHFFTPESEIDLCGHATIASFSLLHRMGRVGPGSYSMGTRAGVLQVSVEPSGKVYMNQTLPVFGRIIDKALVSSCLGLDMCGLSGSLPVQAVSTGLKDIFVPVVSLERLYAINPNYEMIKELSAREGVVGIHAFSTETVLGSAAHCRNFAPLYGIPEESATGTSNGALACYLFMYGCLSEGQWGDIRVEQGYCMGKPSEILARLSVKDGAITGVQVGGNAELSGEPANLSINLKTIDNEPSHY